MAAFTAPYTDFMTTGENAIRTAVDSWTELVRQAFPSAPYFPMTIVLNDAVDRAFELSVQVLQMQRELAKSLLAASTDAAEIAKASLTEAAYFGKRAA